MPEAFGVKGKGYVGSQKEKRSITFTKLLGRGRGAGKGGYTGGGGFRGK